MSLYSLQLAGVLTVALLALVAIARRWGLWWALAAGALAVLAYAGGAMWENRRRQAHWEQWQGRAG